MTLSIRAGPTTGIAKIIFLSFFTHHNQQQLVSLSSCHSRNTITSTTANLPDHPKNDISAALYSGAMELDNANPTIVNPSELPSYRERRKIKDESQKKHGIRQLLMGKSSYAIDPFYLSDYSDTDSDDSNVEPIDEQEIYGESERRTHISPPSLGLLLATCNVCCYLRAPIMVGEVFPMCRAI
jgi:hypothetical protein